jgi:formylglycine-generating enzyme required for sulfatase activity/serine/threonine protein kinase
MSAFACPSCERHLKFKAGLAGKRVRCPFCKHTLLVPSASPVSATLADAATLLPEGTPAPQQPLEDPARAVPAEKDEKPEDELLRQLSPPQEQGEIGRLGPYRVVKVLGAGGMGAVLQAEDPLLKRVVALKVMLPALAASDGNRQRFLQEGQAAAAISHDHVVPIFQVGEANGVPFLAMPLLRGDSLEAAIKRKRLSVADMLRIGRETAEGLAAAHAVGLIHRDIKPANIWLETLPAPVTGEAAAPFRVKILDFGLARGAGGGKGLTQSGAILGTPGYMAPEQASGQAVDRRCDLFSLGCVLYRMATGRPAFPGSDMLAVLMAIATETPPPPDELNPNLPTGLSALIMQLLEKAPADRPPSAAAVAGALAALERQGPAEHTQREGSIKPEAPGKSAVKEGTTRTYRRGPASNRTREGAPSPLGWVLVAGGCIGLAVVAGVLFLLRPGKDNRVSTADIAKAAQPGENEKPEKPIVPEKVELGKDWGKEITNSIGIKLVRIPAGTFTMGSTNEEQDESLVEGEKIHRKKLSAELVAFLRGEGPQHKVEITKDFYLGVYEVTQRQYRTIMGINPSFFSAAGWGKDKVKGMDTNDFPVEQVFWDEAVAFCKKLSDLPAEKKAGRTYRLPTEAEWEYACRGGAPSYQVFHFGNSLSSTQANFNGTFPYGGADKGDYLERPCIVGSYPANGFGLYDMHGNVAEWCSDWYDKDYYSKSPRRDPQGPSTGIYRVIRNVCWRDYGRGCRSAARSGGAAANRYFGWGFRVTLVPAGRE